MTSINQIEKVQYTSGVKDELISLKEYIFFIDNRNKYKFIVFKFKNNVTQYLHEFKMFVYQYDKDNNLIARSLISCNKLKIKENDDFVPSRKMKVEFKCHHVSVLLNYAVFETMIFENGETRYNKMTFDEYENDHSIDEKVQDNKTKTSSKKINKIEEKKKEIETKKIKKDKIAKNKKIDRKKYNVSKKVIKAGVLVKECNKQNKTKGPFILCGILTTLLVAFNIYGLFAFKINNKTLIVGDYVCSKNREGKLDIIKYRGKNKMVDIPSSIKGNEVRSIKSLAFENSNITKVNFSSSIIICEQAFVSCSNLIEVTSDSSAYIEVSSFSFASCENLEQVSLPNSIIFDKAFYNCKSIISFTFGDSVDHNEFGKIFGVSNEKLNEEYHLQYINKLINPNPSKTYYDGLENIKL